MGRMGRIAGVVIVGTLVFLLGILTLRRIDWYGEGCEQIFEATKKGDLESVKTLLANPSLAFSRDKDSGATPLHWAVRKNHKEIAAFLLAQKAEVNAKDNSGRTPLHWAACFGEKAMVELLLANKAQIEVKDDEYGGTPLFFAAADGDKDVAELLLANGAEINAKAKEGYTPLRIAVVCYERTLKELEPYNKHGVSVTNNVLLLSLNRLKEVAELLRKHGGHE